MNCHLHHHQPSLTPSPLSRYKSEYKKAPHPPRDVRPWCHPNSPRQSPTHFTVRSSALHMLQRDLDTCLLVTERHARQHPTTTCVGSASNSEVHSASYACRLTPAADSLERTWHVYSSSSKSFRWNLFHDISTTTHRQSNSRTSSGDDLVVKYRIDERILDTSLLSRF